MFEIETRTMYYGVEYRWVNKANNEKGNWLMSPLMIEYAIEGQKKLWKRKK